MPLSPKESKVPEDFTCLGCGACCRVEGIVRIREAEIEAAAACLDLAVDAFLRRYTVLRPDREGLMLAEREDGACVLLAPDNRCRIHAVKPEPCKTFPWKWRNDDSEKICPALRKPLTIHHPGKTS